MQDKKTRVQNYSENEQFPYNIYSEQNSELFGKNQEPNRYRNRRDRRQNNQKFGQYENGEGYNKQRHRKDCKNYENNHEGRRHENRRNQQSGVAQIKRGDVKEGDIPEHRRNQHWEKRQRKERRQKYPNEHQMKFKREEKLQINQQIKINERNQDNAKFNKPREQFGKVPFKQFEKEVEKKIENMNINEFQGNRRHNQRRHYGGFEHHQKAEKHQHYHRGNHNHHEHERSDFHKHNPHHRKNERDHQPPRQQVNSGEVRNQFQNEWRHKRKQRFGQENNMKFEKRERRQRGYQNNANWARQNKFNPEELLKVQNLKQPVEVKKESSQVKQSQQKQGQQKEVPEALLCPISQILMNDPIMITVCGHSFENQMITSWLKKEKSCPLCKKPCSEANLQKNYALLSLVGIYR